MAGPETTMGTGPDAFPETLWSLILSSRDPLAPDRPALLNRLCTQYWRPVYKFIRASLGKSVEDAKDLTQSFFAEILQDDFLSRYRPEQGRFRTFLKGALRKFLAEDHRNRSRFKRGGGKEAVALEVDAMENDAFKADLRRFTPEQIYDREWAKQMMAECLARLRESLIREGKEVYFRVYEAFDLRCGGDGATHEEIARSLNITAYDVGNYLTLARSRLRQILEERVSQYVTSREELDQELRELGELFR